MPTQNVWVTAFFWTAIVYLIVIALVFAGPVIDSIKDALQGKPLKTLRDCRIEANKADYAQSIALRQLKEPPVGALKYTEGPKRCPHCHRPYYYQHAERFEQGQSRSHIDY